MIRIQASASTRGALVSSSLSSSFLCRRSLPARFNAPVRIGSSDAEPSPATPRRGLVIRASYEPNKQERGQAQAKTSAPMQFNPIYAAICGGFAALFLFQNPYIFAALTILIIIPQNSATTSLNSLVLLFYDSGIFLNFAEAVQCVRLVSWLSVICMLIAFAVSA